MKSFCCEQPSVLKKRMPQSGVGSMQGSNEYCPPMKGHTWGGGATGVDFTSKTFFHRFWCYYTHFFWEFPGNLMVKVAQMSGN